MIKGKKINRKQEKMLFMGFIVTTFFLFLFFPRVYLSDDIIKNKTIDQYALGEKEIQNTEVSTENRASNDFTYLSDIDYIASQSKPGWGSILKDTTSAGTKISVKVENAYYEFDKGMWAHAASTLVYDISEYNYEYFTAYVGLNKTAASSSNGVKFYIYTSMDGKTWELKTDENPNVLKAGTNAEFVKVPIKGAKFLKLYADSNGANGNDHSVYADAKLTNEIKENNVVESVSYYDEQLKKFLNTDLTNPDYELLLLQRNLVKNMGQYAIKRFVGESNENKETFDWLFNNLENLRLYTLGGVPEGGSYYNSLTVLSSILTKYKSDFDMNEETKYGTRYGDLYKRMAIALSLTHSKLVGLWMQSSQPENKSDAVTRYEIYKMLHRNNKFVVTPSIDITKWFENYTIEEMRFVMNNNIDDEEILWLNEYTQSYVDQYPSQAWKYLTPHPYMAYVWPNYSNPIFHDPEKKDYWDEKFNGIFSKYGVTYRNGLYKVWMNFRNEFGTGAVCGGISKTGANIRGVHGIPAAVIGQPGHAAIIYYSQDDSGNGYWNLDNDVSGWTLSEKGERMLLGWGNASFSRGYSVVYMALSQEVLNNFDTFEKSEKLVYLADVYKEDVVKQEEIYKEALKIQPLNIDAWYGLITTFNANPNKTEADYFKLAEDLGESLKYFPLPMQHLSNLIKPKLTSIEYDFKFTLLQTRILTEGGKTPNNTADHYTVYQPSLTRLEANYLLGKLDKDMASFSFDGENASKIVLASRFNENGVRWDYSLDGKQNWKEVYSPAGEEHSIKLTHEEIESITPDNDIYVHIVGAPYSDENIFKIDITKATISNLLFGNDLENRVVGVDLTYEWRYSEMDSWTSYKEASPDLTGNKRVEVRVGATSTKIPSDVATYTFTEDNQPDTAKYIPVSHLKIKSVSTEATNQQGNASNAIDGNYNTRYHSAWNGSDTERYMVIEIDKPIYLSKLEFVPAGGGNGRIVNGTIYGSMDGETWEELTHAENFTYPTQANDNEAAIRLTKTFTIDNPKEVKFVKIVADRTNGNWFAARAFNFYQDTTINPHPTAGIGYSTTEPTQGSVIARLINYSSPNIEIICDEGDTECDGLDFHTFTENGTYEFKFRDTVTKQEGSAVAKVNWIDKEKPSAIIKYSPNHKTNKDVNAYLTEISEDIYLLDEFNNKVNYIETANDKVIYIQYLNANGDITKILHLNDKEETESITYYYEKDGLRILYTVDLDEKGNVTNETFTDEDGNPYEPADKDEIRKLDTIGRSKPLQYTFEKNGEFAFRLEDKAGNRNIITAKVDFIDRVKPLASISYDTATTKDRVTATVEFDKNNVSILNNNGQNTFIFTENGEFTFEYKDEAGNTGSIIAKVDWIEKKVELPNIRLHYSEEKETKNPVTVLLINQGGPITITNNNGSNMFTFTKNGEFTFQYIDAAGNVGSITAKVNWIIKKEEKPDKEESNTNDSSDKKEENSTDNKWTSSTGTKKPTSGNKIPSVNVPEDKNDTVDNNDSSDTTLNQDSQTDNTNKEQKPTQNEDEQQENEKADNQNNVKSNKFKWIVIGFISFISFLSILRVKMHSKIRR